MRWKLVCLVNCQKKNRHDLNRVLLFRLIERRVRVSNITRVFTLHVQKRIREKLCTLLTFRPFPKTYLCDVGFSRNAAAKSKYKSELSAVAPILKDYL
jgi:hypothetical protein